MYLCDKCFTSLKFWVCKRSSLKRKTIIKKKITCNFQWVSFTIQQFILFFLFTKNSSALIFNFFLSIDSADGLQHEEHAGLVPWNGNEKFGSHTTHPFDGPEDNLEKLCLGDVSNSIPRLFNKF